VCLALVALPVFYIYVVRPRGGFAFIEDRGLPSWVPNDPNDDGATTQNNNNNNNNAHNGVQMANVNQNSMMSFNNDQGAQFGSQINMSTQLAVPFTLFSSIVLFFSTLYVSCFFFFFRSRLRVRCHRNPLVITGNTFESL
jgi:predicted PurR-regulated permease PerM